MSSSNGILAPTSSTERISSLDVIRGVALLGILLMNITGFGLSHAYFDPTVSGGATGWNLKVWWMDAMFFEGTMRGMFSMLFGAGIVLFTSRPNVGNQDVTDVFFRRLLWLFLFGIIHAYILLWDGEILYPYALVGMFVFSFRKWEPKYLVIGTIVLLSISTLLSVKEYYQIKKIRNEAVVAQEKKDQGQILAKADSLSITKWTNEVADEKPSQEKIDKDIAARHKGYFSILLYKAHINQNMQTYVMYRYFFWDIFAMMLLGIAFLKNGILKAAKSNQYYTMMVLVGYAIGLTTNYFESSYIISHHFEIVPAALTNITYDLGRLFTTIGHVGVIMLFYKSGILPFLQKSLAAVGQMAFTNYIMQTLICNTIFLGFGFSMYGKLQRYELYYVVIGVWIFQLIASPVWLKYFRFGPMEWVWRSLTYWKKQPFKREQQSRATDVVEKPVSA
ncbi:MAG TPA: DUF418 domain-containing protein [Cyclobacteriaceae bacterium]|nr:DUF418 domain-containing protein [Cyclobacteriaceae bacterium]